MYFVNVSLFQLFIDSWMIFWWRGRQNRIDFKLLLLHFLMMTPALMRVSSFYKDCHEIKYVIEPSFGFYFKSFFKIFQKDCVFEFLLLTPMSLFLIDHKLFILMSLKMERHLTFFLRFWVRFFSFWRNLSWFYCFHLLDFFNIL